MPIILAQPSSSSGHIITQLSRWHPQVTHGMSNNPPYQCPYVFHATWVVTHYHRLRCTKYTH